MNLDLQSMVSGLEASRRWNEEKATIKNKSLSGNKTENIQWNCSSLRTIIEAEIRKLSLIRG
jgi:hypothetical protein